MDCVVTGGAGFIGSNLVDALVARGDRVAVIDNLSTGKRENLAGAIERGATLEVADVRDDRGARPGIRRRPTRARVPSGGAGRRALLGRASGRGRSHERAGNDRRARGSAAAGARRVVNSSTGGGLYGDADVLPTPEDHPISPLAPYGQGKQAAEGYCELYARLHGLSTVSLRYGNVYGPRQDIHGEAGVVAIFCGCLIEGRSPTVFGDGRQTRDWVEVSDVVRANLLAAESSLTGPTNIAWGKETSVLDLLGALSDVSDGGPLADPSFAPERPGEVRRSCLDVRRARRELGWEAKVELRDGLRGILAGS